MNRSRRTGFTLVEVVTVLAVIGVVSTLGTAIFFKMTSGWAQVRGRSELDARIEHAFEQIQRDVNEVISQELSGEPLRGILVDEKSELFFDRVLSRDRVVLPVRAAAKRDDIDVAGLVMYRIDTSQEPAQLVRTTGEFGAAEPSGNPAVMAAGVLRFTIEYAPADGSGEWVRGWDRAQLPAALRVSMTLLDPDQPGEQVARKAVFPIHAH